MCYSVEYAPRAIKDLKKLDKQTRQWISDWIEKNLVGCENPRQHGKGLTANLSGKWRYRVGDYRIIADIQDAKIVIMVLSMGIVVRYINENYNCNNMIINSTNKWEMQTQP